MVPKKKSPNAILEISALKTDGISADPMGSLSKILAFDIFKNIQHLPNYGRFCESRFFNENRLNRFFPPSWILFQQPQRLFLDL
jgi:hypothetical protein